VTAVQAGDNPQLAPLLDDYAEAQKDRACPAATSDCSLTRRTRVQAHRAELRSRKIKHTIPERSDPIARRTAKGPDGGRPPAFDAALYALRNTIERGFNRLKQWRGIATRYAVTYLGGVSWLAPSSTHASAPHSRKTRPSRLRIPFLRWSWRIEIEMF
jgi:putative transposase